MKKSTKKPKLKNTGRGGSIDEAAAFAFYCEHKPDGRLVSYAEVAEKIGVSATAIENLGSRKDWVRKRMELGEQAIVQTTKTLGEQLKDKNIEHLKEFEKLTMQGRHMLDGTMEAFYKKLKKGTFTKNELRFSAVVADIAKGLIVEGIKGQRVALGLPTDVTKSMALNLNLTEELPKDELERMQQFLDLNFNKKQNGNDIATIPANN